MKRKGLALLAHRGGRAPRGLAAAGAKQHGDASINGAGSTFVSPLVSAVDAGPRLGVRLHAPVRRRRLGRRHPGDHATAPSTSAPPTRR